MTFRKTKNVESKNKQQLVTIKNQGERQLQAIRDQGEKQLHAVSSYSATSKSHKIEFNNEKNQEEKKLFDEVDKISRKHKNKKFICFHSNGTSHDFNKFRDIKQLGNDILHDCISIKQANDEMKDEMAKLENYNPTNDQKVNSQDKVLNNAKRLSDIRSSIIKAFEDGVFPLSKEVLHKNQSEEEEKEEIIPDWIKAGNHAFDRIRERIA